MKTGTKFSIAALSLAGFGNLAVADDNQARGLDSSDSIDQVDLIVERLSTKQTFTLAQHQSHASHSSHGSHGSHRSYYAPPPIDDLRVENENGNGGIQLATVRNDRSTPNTSILPSSPAITQKLKPLPGNSEKFRQIIEKMKLALISRGYQITTVNGDLDARTMAEVYKFQGSAGLPRSGKVTPETLSALNISTE